MDLKPKFPRAEAIRAARSILAVFIADRVIVAGSLRRRKALVGDIEILYIPKVITVPDPADFFASKRINHSDQSILAQVHARWIAPRENVLGRTTWGEANKLAVHLETGIPVDFFATTEDAWWNYLVCRTGSAETNMRIATAAKQKGWAWHPYRSGFTDDRGRWIRATSEREVFELAGLPYLEPWER